MPYTKEQYTRKHEQGVFESKGESGKREVKQSSVTLGRRVVSSKAGAEVSKERSASVKSTRARREKTNCGK